MSSSAREIVRRFGLQPHPEGGFYREVYRSPQRVTRPAAAASLGAEPPTGATRSAVTVICFLLEAGDFSAFHRVVGADEIWQIAAGDPLELHQIDRDGRHRCTLLATAGSPEPAAELLAAIPAGVWQAARPAPGSAWSLCTCAVAPGFDFADFEMPQSETLLALFPQHGSLIGEFTRK